MQINEDVKRGFFSQKPRRAVAAATALSHTTPRFNG
jgi:hypothetical protein